MINTLQLETTEHTALADLGLVVRNLRDDSDFERMSRVLIACRNADGLEEARSANDLRTMYSNMKHFDPARNLFLVEKDGELVAYVGGRWWQEQQGDYIHAFWICVLPEWREQGIEDELLHRSEAQLAQDALAHPQDGTNWFEMFAFDSQRWAIELVTAHGYMPIRYFFDMVCTDLTNLPHVSLPPEIETRPVMPDQYRQIWDAEGEAFRDHWGESVEDESDYDRWLASPLWNPDLWQVAWQGDQPVGMVRNFVKELENKQYNQLRGYTENISVRKPWRGRGIAKALLVKSMKMFRDMGFDQTALGVDTENATGARQLYESVGYKTVRTMTIYRRRF